MAQVTENPASRSRGSLFCPPVDALTLLQFRTDVVQSQLECPPHQEDGWLLQYWLIVDLLMRAGDGPVELGLP